MQFCPLKLWTILHLYLMKLNLRFVIQLRKKGIKVYFLLDACLDVFEKGQVKSTRNQRAEAIIVWYRIRTH